MTNPLGVRSSSGGGTVQDNYPQYFKQHTDKPKFCSEIIISFYMPRA